MARNEAPARTLPHGDLDARVEYITPEIAKRYLLRKIPGQRQIRPAKVAQYATDMRAGKWALTHQGIAFDSTGRLIDGQHRLAAVVQSGASVDMMVTRGLEGITFVGMDRGLLRAPADNAPEPWMASRAKIAVARMAMMGYEGLNDFRTVPRPTDWQTFDFMESHRQTLEFVAALFRNHRTGIGQAAVQAAFLRAAYHVGHDLLEKCVPALARGILPDETFSGVGALRSFLTSPRRRRGGGGIFQAEVYAKTERALYAVVRGESVYRLHAATEELFPLPDIA